MSTFRKKWKGISMQKGASGRGGVRPAGCFDQPGCAYLDPGCGCSACACCSCCSRAYNC